MSGDERRLAVAFSGGGHRACLFALGVALYLADAERLQSVTSIASVSGGSFANGALAQSLDVRTSTPEEVQEVVGRTAKRTCGLGTLFGWWFTSVYILIALLPPGAIVAVWLLSWATVAQAAVTVAIVLAAAWLVGLRGRVAARAFGATLFSVDRRRPIKLKDIKGDGVDHVFLATELHAGEHVGFAKDFVYSYRFGVGEPGSIALHRVVQASAAFPGAFPVTWLRTPRFGFANGPHRAPALALVDGGVYDNMGDQWAQGLPDRANGRFNQADELVVVSASAGLAWGRVAQLRVPWLGELLALLRDKAVLYDNGNSVRRRELVARFNRAEAENRGLRGVLVHIEQSPYRLPEAFARRQDPRADRANAALEALNATRTPDDWQAIATANAKVPTTLMGLKRDVATDLLHHAYVLAMVNLHVILDHPLLPMPDRDRFAKLLR